VFLFLEILVESPHQFRCHRATVVQDANTVDYIQLSCLLWDIGRRKVQPFLE